MRCARGGGDLVSEREGINVFVVLVRFRKKSTFLVAIRARFVMANDSTLCRLEWSAPLFSRDNVALHTFSWL